MAMTGYNPTQVSSSINAVKSAYRAYNDAMNTGIQNRFVKPMESLWACEDAQNFFQQVYEPTIKALYAKAEASLASVVASMNDAAAHWAQETASEFSPINHEQIADATDVSGIKLEINGVKGVDRDAASSTASQLANIKNEAENALVQAKQAVANSGFVGGDQQAQIDSSLEEIKRNVSEAITTITEAVKKSIDTTVENYGSLEAAVSKAFAGE